MELSLNENRFGAPIHKEQNPFADVKESNAYMHFNSVNPISKGLMHTLAKLTTSGNPKFDKPLVDVNPAVVDYMISSYLPGLFSEAYKGVGFAISSAEGRKMKERPIPIVDRFNAKTPEGFDTGANRRVTSAVETVFKEFNDLNTSTARRQQIVDQHPYLSTAKAIVSGTNQELRKMSSSLAQIESDPRISDSDKIRYRNQIEEQKKFLNARLVRAAVEAGFKDEVIDNKSEGILGRAAEKLRR
jgi:hypothetical protein